MKTMLKRKLSKVSLIAFSFLFIAATSGGKTIAEQLPATTAICDTAANKDASIPGHSFDSTGLCSCLPALTHTQLSEAPKIEMNKHARDFVKNYLKQEGFFLEKIKAKSVTYFDIIDTVFTKYDLPVELKYLAVIESKLNNTISSPAGAAGLWQLMPVPARQFGLTVKGKVDERKNSYKSTVAAAKCLIYLHKMFDDWLLTLAAYNSGPGRVFSAIKRSGSRNFWVLQNFLPEETRKHVKKFIAMHYYFEGHGSLTTLTKTETQSHIKAVASFVEKQKETSSDTLTTETVIVNR